MIKKTFLPLWIAVAVLCSGAGCLYASEPRPGGDIFYADESLEIARPAGIELSPCPDKIRRAAGRQCAMIGKDGRDGAIFLTVQPGYALGSHTALEAHLEASSAALSDIPNVDIVQTNILGDMPLVAMIELLRGDRSISSLLDIEPPLRQTAFLYPTGNSLAQVFVYLSDREASPEVYDACFETFSKPKIFEPPIAPERADAGAAETQGTLSLLPRALMFGGALALAVILLMLRRSRLRKLEKQREDRINDAKIERNLTSFEDLDIIDDPDEAVQRPAGDGSMSYSENIPERDSEE